MKVGLILEGEPDKAVCKLLIERLQPGTEVVPLPLGPKQKLIAQCGKVAATLFKTGCDCVIILWDLYPAWGAHGAKPCLKRDREGINKSLTDAAVSSPRVHLVCIHKMLESWLLADERALSEFLSKLKKTRITVPRIKRPEDPIKPKTVLSQIARKYANYQFQAHIDAELIMKEVKDFKRLAQCKSFAYFRLKLADC